VKKSQPLFSEQLAVSSVVVIYLIVKYYASPLPLLSPTKLALAPCSLLIGFPVTGTLFAEKGFAK
jgi:hypothetical protein